MHSFAPIPDPPWVPVAPAAPKLLLPKNIVLSLLSLLSILPCVSISLLIKTDKVNKTNHQNIVIHCLGKVMKTPPECMNKVMHNLCYEYENYHFFKVVVFSISPSLFKHINKVREAAKNKQKKFFS